jgi:hypothetical protein
MVSAAERKLGEADVGRIGGKSGSEVLNVEKGADNGDGEALCLLELPC